MSTWGGTAGPSVAAAPYSSSFGGVNYYPTSVFKRSSSAPNTAARQQQQQQLAMVATPAPQRTSSVQILRGRATRSGSGSGTAQFQSQTRPQTQTRARAASADIRPQVKKTPPSPAAAPGPTKGAGRVPVAAGEPPSPQPRPPVASDKAPWNGSASADHGSSGSGRLRFSSSPSPAGLTPSAAARGRHGSASASAPGESTFLSHPESDVFVCAEAHCMHSRESIAEFIAMQRELRRCYGLLRGHEAAVAGLEERLAAAAQALADRDAAAEARAREMEKEFLVELAKREEEAYAAAWERARAEPPAPAGINPTSPRSYYSSKCPSPLSQPPQQHLSYRHTSAAAIFKNRDSDSEGEGEEAAHEARSSRQDARLDIVSEMRDTIIDLENTLATEREERRGVLDRLRVSCEETMQLQSHVRLLSAWKEDHQQQQQRQQLNRASEEGRTPAAAPAPAPVPVARSPSQTPLQKLLARGSLSPVFADPAAAAGAVGSAGVSPVASDCRSPSPSRPAPTLPRGATEAAGATAAAAAVELAAFEARCRELLRALLDKERQLAVIAAERTHFRKLCEASRV